MTLINNEIDFKIEELLQQYRENPYEEIPIFTPHTGVIKFKVKDGDEVKGVEGQWNHIPGTTLFTIEREKNLKKITSPIKGKVSDIKSHLEGTFIEANEQVMVIKKLLDKKEVIEKVLSAILIPYKAKEDARYYLISEIAQKMDSGNKITINTNDEVLIMSLMKRDTIIKYDGEPGVIYSVYFQQGDLVEKDKPLLGICPVDKLTTIERIVERINLEWDNALVCHKA